MVVHTCNPNTRGTEQKGSPGIGGQLELHNETLSQNLEKNIPIEIVFYWISETQDGLPLLIN